MDKVNKLKYRAFDPILNELGSSVLSFVGPVDLPVGIKDRNGKEYFFNDIVDCYKDGTYIGRGVLVWEETYLAIASGYIGNYHAIDQASKAELEESEIIGNIHENPELIGWQNRQK